MKHCLCVTIMLLSLLLLCAQNAELAPVSSSPTGTIKIFSKFGGDLYLDGEFVQSILFQGTATWDNIPIGAHDVELKNTKGEFKHTITISKDKTFTLDFDSPPPPQTPSPKAAEETNSSSAASAIKPILNSHTFGFGTLEVNSGVDGDIYLGGEYLGSVKEDEGKKFKKIPAGEYSVELFNRQSCFREDIEISNKYTSSVTFPRLKAKPYPHEMLYIPEGSFFMGSQFLDRSEYERPRHEVSLSPFLMGTTEVTQALWEEVMGSNPSVRTSRQQPVTNVSWYRVLEFCNALSIKDGLVPCYRINKEFPDANNEGEIDSLRYSVSWNCGNSGYRLPTEAEWEYAARCGDSVNRLQYSGSYKVNEVAWFGMNSNKRVWEVGLKKANEFGLYDMSGNVFEWCWDWWAPYDREAQENPIGAKSGTYRVIRGGGWQSEADLCSTTARGGNSAHASAKDLGFRLVRNARAY